MQSSSRLRIVTHVAFLATPGDSGTSVILMGIQYSQHYSTNAIVFQRENN